MGRLPFPFRRRPAAGAHLAPGPLSDLVAPDGIHETPRHVEMDGTLLQTIALTRFPATVSVGWLGALAAPPEPMDLAIHLEPQPQERMIRTLTRKMTELETALSLSARAGQTSNAAKEQALDHNTRLRARLQRGDDRVHRASLLVSVYGDTSDHLDDQARLVEGEFGAALAGTRRAWMQQVPGLASVLPAAHDQVGHGTLVDGASLSTLFPFGVASLTMPDGVFWGINQGNRSPVIVDPFDAAFTNANSAIIGTAGGGKSYTAKLGMIRELALGTRVLVLDPEHEYLRLAELLGGQVIRLSAGSPHRINPLALPHTGGRSDPDEDGVDLLADHIATVHGLLAVLLAGPGGTLSAGETAVLDEGLYSTYAEAGITADRRTHGATPPTLGDLARTLVAMEESYGLARNLRHYTSGSLAGIFSGHTTVELDNPFTVFALRDLADELRPAAMYMVAAYVWTLARSDRDKPRHLYVDEFHLLAGDPSCDRMLATIARRARKYYLGLTCLSQDARDFLDSKAGMALLINSSMTILLRQEDAARAGLAQALTLSDAERAYLLGCQPGQGLMIVQHPALPSTKLRLPVQFLASPALHPYMTTNPRERRPRGEDTP